jgi:hypothetical protein
MVGPAESSHSEDQIARLNTATSPLKPLEQISNLAETADLKGSSPRCK